MRGVKLDFTGSAPVFDWTEAVPDFDATVQNSIVNLGTMIGSDMLYPDRGTYLVLDAAQGVMVNLQWANNSANFAAIKTIVFSQNNDVPGNPFGLQSLTLTASVYNIKNLNFNIGAVCVNGTTVGTAVTV